jgi:hypothetical protein
MKESGILDIINSIAVFQLLFFTVFLFIRGNKIPSTFFLKVHLFFQLVSYLNYLYFSHNYSMLRPLLLLSMPSTFIWAPTFYFYIRSRLYIKYVPSLKLMIHGIPAILLMIIILILLIQGEFFHEHVSELGNALYYCYKIQLLVYNGFTLLIIYLYQHDI